MSIAAQLILIFGFKGQIIAAGSKEQIALLDQRRAEQNQHQLVTPLCESKIGFEPIAIPVMGEDPGYKKLTRALRPIYNGYARFGHFGDVITVIRTKTCYIVTNIGAKAFPKPGMASDLVPVIIDEAGSQFFVGIIRGQNPGKGKPALIGGFNNKKEFILDPSPKCLIGESREEVGMTIIPKAKYMSGTGSSPFPSTFPVEVHMGGNTFRTQIYYLDTFYTGREEENHSLGEKRVDITSGYLLPIRLNTTTNVAELTRHFVPEDMVENNQVKIFRIGHDTIPFGISHHHLVFEAAVDKLKKIQRLMNM